MFHVFVALPLANVPRREIEDAIERLNIPARDRQIEFFSTYYDDSSTVALKDRIARAFSQIEDADAVYFLDEFMSRPHYRLLKCYTRAMNRQVLHEIPHFDTHKENNR